MWAAKPKTYAKTTAAPAGIEEGAHKPHAEIRDGFSEEVT